MSETSSGHGFRMLVRGLTVGAVAMYLLDPDKGRRRRAVARDKLRRFGNDAARLTQQATRDAGNRLHGVNAALARRRMPEDMTDELKLIERVRSALGRAVTHPHAVQVGVHGSTVVLSGPILAWEVPGLIAAVKAAPGVHEVENHLDVHMSDDRLPSLQGTGRRGERASAIDAPAVRLAMLVGGGVLGAYGLAKRGFGGLALLSAGVGMAVRAVDEETANAVAAAARSAVSSAAGAEGGDRTAARPERGTDGPRRRSAPREEDAMLAPGMGSDGTPAGPAGSGQRTTDITAGANRTPLIGNDGTSSIAGDSRMSAGRDVQSGVAPSPAVEREGPSGRPPV